MVDNVLCHGGSFRPFAHIQKDAGFQTLCNPLVDIGFIGLFV